MTDRTLRRTFSLSALILAIAFSLQAQQRLAYVVPPGPRGSDAPIPEMRRLPAPGEIVIELDATPLLARAEKTTAADAAQLDALLDRLERDLAAIAGPTAQARAKRPRGSILRHRYTLAFAGASARVDPAAVERIRRLDYVKRVHPDRFLYAYLRDSVAQVGAAAAWSRYGVRGNGVVVAVIDTGIDYTHPALGGGLGTDHKVRGGWDFVNDDADPMDDHGHGTHVAGIVAANSTELVGVAPEAGLLAYKVLDDIGFGRDSWVLAAIEEVARSRPHIVNMSLGRPAVADDPVVRAVENASAAGILFCVAAGNSGRYVDIGSPGNAPSALTVGAVDKIGRLARFSSRGPVQPSGAIKPELVAPGVGIVSAAPGGGTLTASGTSMAAPHVAGAAALLRSIHADWPAAKIRSALIGRARSVPGNVMARGAGVIHAVDAAETRLFPSLDILSFGVSDRSLTAWRAGRSITLTNPADVAQTVSIDVAGLLDGIALRPSATSITLEPGASAVVDFELQVDHSKVPAAVAGSLSYGGAVRLVAEGRSFAIPWAFVRASRLRVTWTGTDEASIRVGTADMEVGWSTVRDQPTVELFIGAGQASIWANSGSFGSAAHHVFLEDLDLGVRSDFTIGPADAPHRVLFRGSDPAGRRLSDREQSLREIIFRHPHFSERPLDAIVDVLTDQEIFLSSASEKLQLRLFERAFDLDPRATWIAQYPPVNGVTADVDLTLDADAWKLLPTRAVVPADLERPYYAVWAAVWSSVVGQTVVTIARPDVEHTDVPDTQSASWIVPSRTDDSRASVLIELGERSPAGEDFFGSLSPDIVAEFTASEDGFHQGHESRRPHTPIFPAGQPIVLGEGPVVPTTIVATFEGTLLAFAQWLGPYKEDRMYDAKRMTGVLYNAGGTVVATGQAPPRFSPLLFAPLGTTFFEMIIKLPEAGRYLFEAVNRSFDVSGVPAQGKLSVSFDSRKVDNMAPTFTSLRISGSTLTFSAIDLTNSGFGEVQPDKTKIEYRRHGAEGPWSALTTIEVGKHLEPPSAFGPLPDGVVYQADVSALTGTVDLRLSVEDAEGNAAVYVLEPARVVPTHRRRAVSR